MKGIIRPPRSTFFWFLLKNGVSLYSKLKVMTHYNPNTQKREQMIKDGAYDGRFRSKVVKDKKKESSKRWARMK